MELQKALDQISEIHRFLARSEVYRGYRSLPMGVAGGLALLAAFVQEAVFPPADDLAYIRYWVLIAAVCGALSSSEIVFNYVFREDRYRRRQTRRVVGQFLPCLAAGTLVTGCLAHGRIGSIEWIPGLWAVLFGLGVFSSRPYLPHATGYVGLFYLLAGTSLLVLGAEGLALSPWSVGGTFGIGQLLLAAVLYWNVERRDHG